jgi:hypothetical protein
VPAIAARVRVLHREQLEIFFPIRPLFVQRRVAKTRFHPGGDARLIDARLPHIVLILIAGDGAFAERVVIDRLKQRFFLAGFYLGFDEIPHRERRNLLHVKGIVIPSRADGEESLNCNFRFRDASSIH